MNPLFRHCVFFQLFGGPLSLPVPALSYPLLSSLSRLPVAKYRVAKPPPCACGLAVTQENRGEVDLRSWQVPQPTASFLSSSFSRRQESPVHRPEGLPIALPLQNGNRQLVYGDRGNTVRQRASVAYCSSPRFITPSNL